MKVKCNKCGEVGKKKNGAKKIGSSWQPTRECSYCGSEDIIRVE